MCVCGKGDTHTRSTTAIEAAESCRSSPFHFRNLHYNPHAPQRDLAEAYEEPATPEAMRVHEDPDSPLSRESGSAARHSSSSAGASARIDKSLSGLTEK